MERLAVIGVSHSRGGPEAIAAFQERYRGPRDVASLGFPEVVVVATCNRFEAVVALPPATEARSARSLLLADGGRLGPAFVFAGDAAVERLMRVAASLDSLNPGEDQVMRQVRRAYAEAQRLGTTGRLTTFAFEHALRAARRVRREVPLAPLNTSLFTLALPRLRAVLRPGDRVAVIGAGEMGRAAAVALGRDDLGLDVLVVNRDEGRGAGLATEVGGRWAPLEAFLASPEPVAAAVCATPRRHLLDAPTLAAARKAGAPPRRVACLRGGMRRLHEALAEALGERLVTGAEVASLRPLAGAWEVAAADGRAWLARSVVLATPAYAAARLLEPVAPEAAALLAGVPYVHVDVVALGYRRADVPPLEGFGFVAPRGEGVRSLGVVYASTVAPDLAPEGHVLFRAIAGGALDPAFHEMDEGDKVAAVRADLALTLGVTAEPVAAHAVSWRRGIPQYRLGHAEGVGRAEAALAGLPPLWLAGDAYRGLGVADRLREGVRLARELAAAHAGSLTSA